MSRLRTITVLLAALFCVAASQRRGRGCGDDDVSCTLHRRDVDDRNDAWRSIEDEAFVSSGACASQNRSYVATCHDSTDAVTKLLDLRSAECFCDEDCHRYGDCCLDVATGSRSDVRGWTCRVVRGEPFNIPIYVWGTCAEDWRDPHVRTLCETEAHDLDSQNLTFSHLQDVPVKSEVTGVFYRNVFCAVCNGEVRLVRWNTTVRCSGVPDPVSRLESELELDFSSSVYDTRTLSFKNVSFRGEKTNCRMQIHDFRLPELVGAHSARLCKPFIDTCSALADEETSLKCRSYASFVYSNGYPSRRRNVYKNFHCALCNGVDVRKITCNDPWSPFVFTRFPKGVSLSFLFDFNFEGDNNQIGVHPPCKLEDGFIWDRVMKKCISITCGALFEWEGSKCVPKPGVGLKDLLKIHLNDLDMEAIRIISTDL